MKNVTFINAPDKCDTCGGKFEDKMYDAATIYGPWACMCTHCFNTLGKGLGTGLGQEYTKQGDQWVKVAG